MGGSRGHGRAPCRAVNTGSEEEEEAARLSDRRPRLKAPCQVRWGLRASGEGIDRTAELPAERQPRK